MKKIIKKGQNYKDLIEKFDLESKDKQVESQIECDKDSVSNSVKKIKDNE
jgi:hypothetical protein